MWLLSACWRTQYCDLFHVKYCPNIYCPYCRQAVWHLNHPPLTSLIWFPFLPYPLSHQHLLAMVHSLLQYPVDLQRSVSFVRTDLILLTLYFLNKASLKIYVHFAWKAKYSFCKSHSIMPFHFCTVFPKSLRLLPSYIINKFIYLLKPLYKQFEGVWLGILTWLFFYSISFVLTSRIIFTSS